MPAIEFPESLLCPLVTHKRVVAKVMFDLTIYLTGPTLSELERLVDIYQHICPPACFSRYKLAEFEYWPRVAQPELTSSGRVAHMAGISRDYIEPVRKRLRECRDFELQYWDGREISDPTGSWSFSCRRLHLRKTGHHTFVRLMFPVDTELALIQNCASALVDQVDFISGHGGLVFVYDSWSKEDAFDLIYTHARRFWGIDIEYLNGTLPLMKSHIKGVQWLTMIGEAFTKVPGVSAELAGLAQRSDITLDTRKYGTVITAGPQPVVGDQHRPDSSLDPYIAVAQALKQLFLDAHPDFPSEKFVTNGNTVGWIRRFIEPDGWR